MKNHSTDPLVVVIPIYEDSEASNQLIQELFSIFNYGVYVVLVDDGSIRQPVDIDNILKIGMQGVVIKLKRNVGHQRAISIGLNYVADQLRNTEKIVIMDSDGEDKPISIKELIKPLDLREVDIVVAKRKSRVETLRFKIFYVVYRLIFKVFTGREINFGNFMALKNTAVKRLVTMHELWIHVAACVLISKLRVSECALDRGARYAGKSKMNFVGLALHGFRGLMVFAEDVLVRVGIACAFVAALSILAGGVAVALKLFGFATPGWFSVALGILVLMFLQTGALTLMTLMLSGVSRNGTISALDYKEFIDTVQYANSESVK